LSMTLRKLLLAPFIVFAAPLTTVGSGQAAETFKDCEVCPEMAAIPSGTFQMGDQTGDGFPQELPVHPVTFAQSFSIGVYEVTFDEWDACVADGGCSHEPRDNTFGRGRQPVINVSFSDANEYAAWLSNKTDKTYRLPTEAEWEYAAKAGTSTNYPWGNDVGTGNANCDGCNGDQNRGKKPVGSFEPNAFGLYDTSGNVMEWTTSCLVWEGIDMGYTPVLEMGGDTSGVANCHRILRGGSWNDPPRKVRSANREWHASFAQNGLIGFRVLREGG